MARRALVSYGDLPHSDVPPAPPASSAPGGEVESRSRKRKKRRASVRSAHESKYSGPHWDDEASSLGPSDGPAWDGTGDNEVGDLYEDDEAVVASPRADDFVIPPPVDIPITGGGCRADEVWDDSFLVDVWNAAEQEYLDFHRRRRESIDAILAERDTPWHRLGAVAAAEDEDVGAGAAVAAEYADAASVSPPSSGSHAATPGWRFYLGADDVEGIHTQWIEAKLLPRFETQDRPAPVADGEMQRMSIEIDGKLTTIGLPAGLLAALGSVGGTGQGGTGQGG